MKYYYILLLLHTFYMSHLILNEWLSFFIALIINIIHGSGVLTTLFGCCMAAATWNCSRLGASSMYNIQMHQFTVSFHSKPVTCHLHISQNDRDLLRAAAVTRVHRKLTLEKKILPPLLPGLEPGSRVRRSNHWAIPAPKYLSDSVPALNSALKVNQLQSGYNNDLVLSSPPSILFYCASSATVPLETSTLFFALGGAPRMQKLKEYRSEET